MCSSIRYFSRIHYFSIPPSSTFSIVRILPFYSALELMICRKCSSLPRSPMAKETPGDGKEYSTYFYTKYWWTGNVYSITYHTFTRCSFFWTLSVLQVWIFSFSCSCSYFTILIITIFRKPVDSTRLLECYKSGKVCHCEQCGGVIKPDILFYNEKVSDSTLSSFQKEAESADLLLILGTSLSTYPVSDCLSYFQNCDIVRDPYISKLMV